ncbi:isoprenylcysteine carboxylmethyltransferase family protein [Chelatococcus sp. SYSU_G07232]|uniref:Isoprenylcysteine carboxylmethyltransferase family protein n=1 Tax=Chelatococcus albus TaxID=3047466 RepID=A0ABT7AM43_9HYPH|nr:isoprenylcysteine carboxylmethyltransferase family protein [Chelatococcus sp. SYSU_G07232]MDJ1159864.1 isoprenylcysteine carboxylmethyltransferase family protein [Chelatococcus sp. SYSU_G07232]
MVLRLIVQTALWTGGMGAVLFVGAGTILWPAAWIYLAITGFGGLVVGLWLAKHDPGLLAERLSPLMQAEQKTWDKVFMVGIVAAWCAWLALIALDAARFSWSHMPLWLQVPGALLLALSLAVTFLAFRANSFAAPVVKVQRERGHRVVSSGPYAYVRHPMYAGALLFFLGTPLLLGSWYGLAATPLLTMGLAARAVLEERTLRAELQGYAAYAERVRYRFIPMVW